MVFRQVGHLVSYYGGQQLAGSVKERNWPVCYSDGVVGLAWLAQQPQSQNRALGSSTSWV